MFNRLWWMAALMLAACVLVRLPAHAGSVAYWTTKAAGVPLKVVAVDLNDLNVRISGQMTQFGAGHAEPFRRMVRRAQPTVAITGTFFSSRLKPIGDVVIDGRLANFGGLGTAMCITHNNEVEFVRPQRYRHLDWSNYGFVVRAGPRLIQNGVVHVSANAEGFEDRHLLAPNPRIAIGVTRSNKLVIVATRKRVYLYQLARAMRALGVVNAINLDGGSSIGLYYKGRTLIRPSRRMTNLIVIYQNRERYEQVKEKLLPVRMRSASR